MLSNRGVLKKLSSALLSPPFLLSRAREIRPLCVVMVCRIQRVYVCLDSGLETGSTALFLV